MLERGVATWPYAAAVQKELILNYVTLKDYPRAHELMKRYVELFPEDTLMRNLLEKVDEGSLDGRDLR